MNHFGKMIDTIVHPDRWPSFDRPDFLEELEAVADRAFGGGTVEGYLAALLIYHQLCEEMARLLLRDGRFFIQLAIYPATISFRDKPKMMFGQVLDELRSSVSFEARESFLERAAKLNELRNELVHRLTRQSTFADMSIKMKEANAVFHLVSKAFLEAHDYFRVCFKDFRKDVFLDVVVEANAAEPDVPADCGGIT